MLYRKKHFQLCLFILLVFFSCKKDKPAPPSPDLGYGYFPLVTGSWIIYDVDSLVHDAYQKKIIPYKFQLKEIVDSAYTDNTGKEVYRIERYKKDSVSDWAITDVWAAHTNSFRAEKFEENIWYIKLIFPVKANAKWNGNSFNSMDEQEYEYTEVNVNNMINGLSFDSTLTVLQADEFNLINKLYSEEKYAKNIGMIYKKYINLDLQNDAGIELFYKINSFGN